MSLELERVVIQARTEIVEHMACLINYFSKTSPASQGMEFKDQLSALCFSFLVFVDQFRFSMQMGDGEEQTFGFDAVTGNAMSLTMFENRNYELHAAFHNVSPVVGDASYDRSSQQAFNCHRANLFGQLHQLVDFWASIDAPDNAYKMKMLGCHILALCDGLGLGAGITLDVTDGCCNHLASLKRFESNAPLSQRLYGVLFQESQGGMSALVTLLYRRRQYKYPAQLMGRVEAMIFVSHADEYRTWDGDGSAFAAKRDAITSEMTRTDEYWRYRDCSSLMATKKALLKHNLKAFGGCRCPRCLSGQVEGGSLDISEGRITQVCYCPECAFEWTPVYVLSHME